MPPGECRAVAFSACFPREILTAQAQTPESKRKRLIMAAARRSGVHFEPCLGNAHVPARIRPTRAPLASPIDPSGIDSSDG